MLYYYLVEILMIDKLIIATANKHKLIEIEAIFKETKISAMPKEIPEILEDGKTFIQNSLIKAKAVYNFTKIPSLADDRDFVLIRLEEIQEYIRQDTEEKI